MKPLLDGKGPNLLPEFPEDPRPVENKGLKINNKPASDLDWIKSRRRVMLSSEPESFDQGAVASDFLFLDIVQKAPAPSDLDQQPPPGMMIFFVNLQVLGQVVDAMGQDGDLDLRRPGVGLMELELPDHLLIG